MEGVSGLPRYPHLNGWFQIFVRNLRGRYISYPVSPNKKISDLKREIQAKERIPSREQRLKYGIRPLRDAMTLQEAGVEAGAVIDLNLTIAAGMKVNLLMQNLKDIFEIDIDENQTIDDLRELAKTAMEQDPSSQLDFLWKGRVISNGADTIGNLHILPQDKLIVLVQTQNYASDDEVWE